MMTDSQPLLADYAATGSERAFQELVARYVDLVYSTALRMVEGDTHRAEDVAQTVFVDLARMAAKLSPNSALGGWLHRHTCFVARTLMRSERRRQARERQAVEMSALDNMAKVYHDVIVQVADAPDFIENVRTLFNNDSDNSSGLGVGTNREYVETYEGKLINAQGVKARYIRFYSKGSTESALNEYTEIEVYGR
jgi:DNA-directed RNA polymerase specialized sigma24 family protein